MDSVYLRDDDAMNLVTFLCNCDPELEAASVCIWPSSDEVERRGPLE